MFHATEVMPKVEEESVTLGFAVDGGHNQETVQSTGRAASVLPVTEYPSAAPQIAHPLRCVMHVTMAWEAQAGETVAA